MLHSGQAEKNIAPASVPCWDTCRGVLFSWAVIYWLFGVLVGAHRRATEVDNAAYAGDMAQVQVDTHPPLRRRTRNIKVHHVALRFLGSV